MTTVATHPIASDVDLGLLGMLAASNPSFADRFRAVCVEVGNASDGWVDPNIVRERMLDGRLEFTVAEAKQYASLWCKAAGRDGFLDTHRDALVPITGAGSTRNGGKSLPMRSLRDLSGVS